MTSNVADGSQLAGQCVLVTGGSGFIGSRLCHQLLALGAEVHGVSRTSPGVPGARWWSGDVSDATTARRLMEAIDPAIVFHLTGHVTAVRDLAAVLPTLQNDLVATVNILAVGTECGVRRVVLTASLEEPPADDHPTPSSPYAAAKWAASSYARMFQTLYKTPVVILRPFLTYGPGDARPHKVIPYVTMTMLRGERPKLTSGRRLLDWVYIDDVVRGLLAAAAVPGIEGRTIDLGSGNQVSVHDVVEQIAQIIDPDLKPEFGALPDRISEQVRVANTADAVALLGWSATVPLEDGLARTVEWFRTHAAERAGQAIAGGRP